MIHRPFSCSDGGRPCRLRPLVCVVALLLGTACGPAAAPPPERRTVDNVLLITIDALRADHVGAYGYPRRTTASIDELAAQGVVFETAYTVYPKTGPSVASLLTGSFPVPANLWSLPRAVPSVAEILADHGFATAAAVDNANLSREFGYARGFDDYLETWLDSEDDEGEDGEIERTRLITEAAIRDLEGFADRGERFFLWLHYVNPHVPYRPPEGFAEPFVGDEHFDGEKRLRRTRDYRYGIAPKAYLDGEHRLDFYVAQYDGEIAFADRQAGEVLERLRSLPGLGDTLVVVTADHGESLGEWDLYFEHGPYLTDADLRVPLVLHSETLFPEPVRVDTTVSLMDVTPTVLDAVGIPVESFQGPASVLPLFGRSLLPVARGNVSAHYPYVFFAGPGQWGVRSGSRKLMKLSPSAIDNSPVDSTYHLVDLSADPSELDDLYRGGEGPGESLVRLLERRLALQESLAEEESISRDVLEEKALENLRALGYIQ